MADISELPRETASGEAPEYSFSWAQGRRVEKFTVHRALGRYRKCLASVVDYS